MIIRYGLYACVEPQIVHSVERLWLLIAVFVGFMKFRTSVGLVVIAISLISVSAILQNKDFGVIALANQIRDYGTDGSTGPSGRSGATGQPGRTQSVRADGIPQQINAIGGDGRDGEDGYRGNYPFCPRQPRHVRYHLQAPDGGNGGNGGDGGSGGHGGDVWLYYADPTALRQMLVNAAGGRFGRGGRGGRGAPGCRCDDRRWRVEVCNDGDCRDEYYDCRDGRSGDYGLDGRDGISGNPGRLWLVDQLEPLKTEEPSVTQSLDSLLNQPVALSKNLWELRRGAGALLAAGSVVADTYHHYMGHLEAQAQIQWQAERSQTAFLSLSPTLTLEDSGSVQIRFPEAYWVDGVMERSGNVMTYVLTHIVDAEQVMNLAWGNQSGRGVDFTTTVIDLGRESAFVDTQFELVYRTTEDDPRDNRRVRYRDHFEGVVPPAVVTQDNNRFVLALGQLPIQGRYLQPGTLAQIELRIVRSLGQHSDTETLQWQGQL